MPINFYNSYSVPAFEGQIDNTFAGEAVSGVLTQASVVAGSAPIAPGRFVHRSGVANNNGISVNATGTSPIGIAIGYNHLEKNSLETGYTSAQALSPWNGATAGLTQQNKAMYPEFSPIAILRKGYIWLLAEANITVGTSITSIAIRNANGTPTAASANGRLAGINIAAVGGATFVLNVNGGGVQPVFKVVRSNTTASGGLVQAYLDFTNVDLTTV
jgi:hypothetical protein